MKIRDLIMIACAGTLCACMLTNSSGSEPGNALMRAKKPMGTPIEGSGAGDLSEQHRTSLQPPVWLEQNLEKTRKLSPMIAWDDRSRYVLFSDCHRGIKDEQDVFAYNEGIFLEALEYYLANGFTYVEVGDGDELWGHYEFEDIEDAYPQVFHLFHQFKNDSRLYLILGNHEIAREEDDAYMKGEFSLSEGLVLKNNDTGRSILVLHGHQADDLSDQFHPSSRVVVRGLWSRIKHTSWAQAAYDILVRREHARIEVQLARWLQRNDTVLITGHTHQLHFPAQGQLPIFNIGHCTVPGRIFGLELEHSQITPIVWQAHKSMGATTAKIERVVLQTPYDLAPVFVQGQ